ncbi:hypothetical protein BH23ACT9_BH23ACT9_07190 [soil metagenome]
MSNSGNSRTTSALPGRRAVPLLLVLLCALGLVVTPPVAARETPPVAAREHVGPDVQPATQHAARVQAAGTTASGGSADHPNADEPADLVPGELLVTTAQGADVTARRLTGWQSAAAFTQADVLSPRVTLVRADPARIDQVTAALEAQPGVLAVEPNVQREFTATPDDTSVALQWAHQQTNASAGWDIYTGRGTVAPMIAILDSGIDATHPDLDGVVVVQGRSVDGSVMPGTRDNDSCRIGHGTAVAGSAAAQGDNGFGVAGVMWQARVIDIALTSTQNGCPGGPRDADTVAAMNWLSTQPAAQRPLVMNLSLSGQATACPVAYQTAIQQARAAGIVVVAASGNFSGTGPTVPASCDGVISVAATGPTGVRASYSQRNPQVDIAAPGGDDVLGRCPQGFAEMASQFVLTTSLQLADNTFGPACGPYTDPNGHRLQGISGTSFSAPYVAGVVAMMRQLAIDSGTPLSVDEAEAILQTTARDAGPPGRDCDLGFGIVDVGAALSAVGSGLRPALQPTPPLGSGSCEGDATVPPADTSCSVRQLPLTDNFVRFSAEGPTNPICQAVAISRELPDGRAPWAVLARADEFPDALAGSAVGLGLGPLLFTPSTGGLDPRTAAELQRVLDRGAGPPTVYIMGGTSAIPPQVDADLEQLGMTPRRVAGDGREATAVMASRLVQQLKDGVDFPTRDFAFVAFGRNWPDAVAAGQMAAHYGVPVLLTNTEELHPETTAELQRLRPSAVFVLGGTAVVSDAVVTQISGMGLDVTRLAGDGRVDTALQVTARYQAERAADLRAGLSDTPPIPIALNMDDNFQDVLSASLLGGLGNVYLPLAAGGTMITPPVRQAFCNADTVLFVIGGTDRIPDATAREAADVLRGTGC